MVVNLSVEESEHVYRLEKLLEFYNNMHLDLKI
jgi:hypothetical protein